MEQERFVTSKINKGRKMSQKFTHSSSAFIDTRTPPDWADKPMRWAQLTPVENDPAQEGLIEFWLDYFKRTKTDGASLSAGGYLAYYPTQIPLHRRSSWLGDQDFFGDLVRGCRDMNMVVIARTDPHAVHHEVYEAHPDWIAVDAEGEKRPHWSMPSVWLTCTLGPYSFKFMTEVHREIMSQYMVDGIFSNRWAGSGMCYCEHCQENFRDAYGMDLPRTGEGEPQDPARRNYILWQQERLFELCHVWDSAIREINPHARFIPNSGGGATSALDMKRLGEFAPLLSADRQARPRHRVPWENGKNGKEFRAGLGRKPVIANFNVGLGETYRWKDSVQSEAELRIWIADAVANGMRPRNSKFAATLHDTRWLEVVESIYTRLHRWEPYLRNEEPLARVAVVYSQQTGIFYGGNQAREKVEDHILGMYHALIEARIPFEMVHEGHLDAAHIDHFKTLILPNIAALSDAQCEQLTQYVKRGGSIVATYETSLYNERGERRDDFGLADLFGVTFKSKIEGPLKNAYLRLEKDPSEEHHPLLKGLERAARITHGAWRLEVQALASFPNPPVTLIPPYPDLPMEEVYPREDHTGIPEVYLRDLGKSRIVYFPWDIDRIFWEILNVDHGRLLGNAIAWATNEEKPVTVTGPGVLDVTVWQQRDSMTVHLVNLTNPMMMNGPFRELIPITEQQVKVRLPDGKKPKRVQLLNGQESPEFEASDGYISLSVPSILDHEVVAIDL